MLYRRFPQALPPAPSVHSSLPVPFQPGGGLLMLREEQHPAPRQITETSPCGGPCGDTPEEGCPLGTSLPGALECSGGKVDSVPPAGLPCWPREALASFMVCAHEGGQLGAGSTGGRGHPEEESRCALGVSFVSSRGPAPPLLKRRTSWALREPAHYSTVKF